jgi:nucleotide-binding universal stress UspA family protein
MIKDILVALTQEPGKDVAADYARGVAAALDAHLTGLSIAYEPAIPPTIMGGIPADFVETQRVENERAAKAAQTDFEDACRRDGLNAETRLQSATLAGAADILGRLSRRYDLTIVGQSDPDKLGVETVLIEAVLFESGRAVLVVPYIHKAAPSFERVMVCWDGSRPAARAIAEAMPLLHKSKRIDVVTFATERGRPEELPGADLAVHLARHGLSVDLKRVPTGGTDIASAILSESADLQTDLIVMGGYGHSRLREFILGGATRGILGSMTVPTLMAH